MGGSLMTAVAIVQSITETKDRNENKMGFVNLFARDGSVRAVCFKSKWGALKRFLKPGELVLVRLEKNERGYKLDQVLPLYKEAK